MRRADDDRQLDLIVGLDRTAGHQHIVARAHHRVRRLHEDHRLGRLGRTGLLGVVAVVEPDANDLANARQRRGELDRRVDSRSVSALTAERTSPWKSMASRARIHLRRDRGQVIPAAVASGRPGRFRIGVRLRASFMLSSAHVGRVKHCPSASGDEGGRRPPATCAGRLVADACAGRTFPTSPARGVSAATQLRQR